MTRWKTWATLVAAIVVPTLFAIGSVDAAPASKPSGPNTTSTSAVGKEPKPHGVRTKGKAAVDRLGTRLPAVATEHGLSTDQLSTQLLTDSTLMVDGADRLLYVEPVNAAGATTRGVTGAPTPTIGTTIAPADAFTLHSKPGANRVIYLDFDGTVLSGTAWNDSTGGDCSANPYDSDSDPTTFSDAERTELIDIWRRVAEDYAPFDVDVTTADPGYAAINRATNSDAQFGTRAVITKSTSTCPNGSTLYASVCPGGCGGIAYVGVYDNTGSAHDTYQPALIFVNGVGTSAKYVAEATSHEVGHNVGLSHDGTSTLGYYSGHGNWAPIMGVGYYKAVSQWSKGEYRGANNSQDDFNVAVSNGLPLRADDHGNTATNATALSGSTFGVEGIIGTRTDVDAFTFTAGAGPATIAAAVASSSPDLDVRLELRDAAGAVVATDAPPSGALDSDVATGMGATVTATLPAPGTYTVLVDGVGSGDPLSTGYSDYGSVGRFRLSGTVPAVLGTPPVASITATTTSGITPVDVAFTGSGSTDPDGGTLTYSWSFGDGGTDTIADPIHTYTTAGTYTVRLTVTDPDGNRASATTTVTVSNPPRRIDISAITATGVRNSALKATATAAVTVRDAAGALVSGATVTGKWYVGTTLVGTKSATTSGKGVASVSSSSVKASPGQVLKFCVSGMALSGGTWDATLYSPTSATDCATWTAT